MKICSKCGLKRTLSFFNKDKYKIDRLDSWCKLCRKLYKKEYRKNNKEKIKIKKRKDYINNKVIVAIKGKEYRLKNNIEIKKRKKLYSIKNRSKINAKLKNKKQTDIQYKIICNLRTRLWYALKNKQKVGSTVRDLGCTGEQLIDWLEHQFEPGMDWNNYGNKEGQWSIDHEYPLSEVDDLTKKELFLPVIHYTNLQPMWHIDNLKKGDNF